MGRVAKHRGVTACLRPTNPLLAEPSPCQGLWDEMGRWCEEGLGELPASLGSAILPAGALGWTVCT